MSNDAEPTTARQRAGFLAAFAGLMAVGALAVVGGLALAEADDSVPDEDNAPEVTEPDQGDDDADLDFDEVVDPLLGIDGLAGPVAATLEAANWEVTQVQQVEGFSAEWSTARIEGDWVTRTSVTASLAEPSESHVRIIDGAAFEQDGDGWFAKPLPASIVADPPGLDDIIGRFAPLRAAERRTTRLVPVEPSTDVSTTDAPPTEGAASGAAASDASTTDVPPTDAPATDEVETAEPAKVAPSSTTETPIAAAQESAAEPVEIVESSPPVDAPTTTSIVPPTTTGPEESPSTQPSNTVPSTVAGEAVPPTVPPELAPAVARTGPVVFDLSCGDAAIESDLEWICSDRVEATATLDAVTLRLLSIRFEGRIAVGPDQFENGTLEIIVQTFDDPEPLDEPAKVDTSRAECLADAVGIDLGDPGRVAAALDAFSTDRNRTVYRECGFQIFPPGADLRN